MINYPKLKLFQMQVHLGFHLIGGSHELGLYQCQSKTRYPFHQLDYQNLWRNSLLIFKILTLSFYFRPYTSRMAEHCCSRKKSCCCCPRSLLLLCPCCWGPPRWQCPPLFCGTFQTCHPQHAGPTKLSHQNRISEVDEICLMKYCHLSNNLRPSNSLCYL